MFGQVVQRGDSARAEPLLLRLIRWQAGPRGCSLQCASATLYDSLDLRDGELATGSHGGYLALANGISYLQQDGCEREWQVAAVEHPLDLFIQLQEDQAGVDARRRYANTTRDLGRSVAAVQQPAVGAGFLDAGQVQSLEILDQHDFLLLDLVQVADNNWHFVESGEARGG